MSGLDRFHQLKTHPTAFDATRRGVKPWEFRLNDRDFEVGDLIDLRLFDPSGRARDGPTDGPVKLGAYVKPSGHFTDDWSLADKLLVRVAFVLRGGFGIPAGYCVLTIFEVDK